MNRETATKIAGAIITPIMQELIEWVGGTEKPGTRRPKVLALLPNELQSEVALHRLEARYQLGIEKRPEPPIAPAAAQESNLRVSVGDAPKS